MSRKDFKVEKEITDKTEMFVQSEGGGVKKVEGGEERVKEAALTDEQAVAIAKLLVTLEKMMGRPQDFEWGMEGGEEERERETCKC